MTSETPVRIVVPSNWKALVGTDLPKLECGAPSVRDALSWLVGSYPQFGIRLFSDERLASWINIYLGDDDIRDLGGLDTQISAPSVLTIVQAVAGG